MTQEERARRNILPSWWLEMEDSKDQFFSTSIYEKPKKKTIAIIENGEIICTKK